MSELDLEWVLPLVSESELALRPASELELELASALVLHPDYQ